MTQRLPLVPQGPEWALDWDAYDRKYRWIQDLQSVPQDPVYHGEGDVWTHTKMVCQELVKDIAWQNLPEEERAIVLYAALLHDVAKPVCTVHEGDRIRSPNHSRRGERMAREILWRDGASPRVREQVASLVRYHQKPYLFLSRDPDHLIREIALSARCDHLAMLAKADIKGRICPDAQEQLETIDLFAERAKEMNCLRAPYSFPSDHSRVLYFHKSNRDPDYKAWDDTRCEMLLMSGLPGAGKDHWLRTKRPGLPVISLDGIRHQIGASFRGNQGAVIQAAREQARVYLRRGENFAWNATNLTRELRSKVLNLAHDYNARIRIVVVDPPAKTLLQQNKNREDVVPRAAIDRMVRRWEMPTLAECHVLEWVIPEAAQYSKVKRKLPRSCSSIQP